MTINNTCWADVSKTSDSEHADKPAITNYNDIKSKETTESEKSKESDTGNSCNCYQCDNCDIKLHNYGVSLGISQARLVALQKKLEIEKAILKTVQELDSITKEIAKFKM